VVTWLKVRHQVALWGRVTDADTGKALAAARVSIEDGGDKSPAVFRKLLQAGALQYGSVWNAMAERPDRTRTADDGTFYFLDLPEGDYTLSASLANMGARYGTAEAKATVSKQSNGDYIRGFVELNLQATTVRGKVMGPRHKNGVVMAEVRVKGSGERTFSDAQGQYVLAALEPGKRTVLAFAQGYTQSEKTVDLRGPGASETLNFEFAGQNG
jgi:hypothetical protein